MSFCRFSSDDWNSDVYVYADIAGGYTVHVAANRVLIERDGLPPITAGLSADRHKWAQQWVARHQATMRQLDEASREQIDHPDAGDSHWSLPAEDVYHLLARLASEGFHVPEGVAEAVLAEATQTG